MRRVNIPKYKAHWGEDKALDMLAAANKHGRVEGHYAYVPYEKWSLVQSGQFRVRRKRIHRRMLEAAESALMTQVLRTHRASDETYQHRLDTCRQCQHARWKNGEVYSCGPMLDRARQEGGKTCGCIIKLKAIDARQSCPLNKWLPE